MKNLEWQVRQQLDPRMVHLIGYQKFQTIPSSITSAPPLSSPSSVGTVSSLDGNPAVTYETNAGLSGIRLEISRWYYFAPLLLQMHFLIVLTFGFLFFGLKSFSLSRPLLGDLPGNWRWPIDIRQKNTPLNWPNFILQKRYD